MFNPGEIHEFESRWLDRRVFLVDWVSISDSAATADLLRGRVTPNSVVVIRINRLCPTNIDEIPAHQFEDFKKRSLPTDLVFLYSSDFEIRVSGLANISLHINEAEFVEAVRTAELSALLWESDAIFRLPEGFYFRSPSNALVDHFLRVGNMQRSVSCLDRLFFWLIPFLRDIDEILIDTWSVSSIALNSIRRLNNYSDSPSPDCVELEILQSYPDASFETHEQLRNIIECYQQKGTQKVLLLFSVNVTGKALKFLTAVFQKQLHGVKFQVLSLYQLVDTDEETLCEFHREASLEIKQGELSEVGKGRVYDVDPVTYFPIILNEKNEERTHINKSFIQDKKFFDLYGGKECFHTHRDSLDMAGHRLRHHAFYIDVGKMLEIREFRETLRRHVLELPERPTMILAPNHLAGKELVDAVIKFYLEGKQVSPDTYLTNRLRDDAPDAFERLSTLSSDTRILVLDDVLITGNRLSQYQEQFRTAGYKGFVSYIVGIARCKDNDSLSRLINQFSWNDHLQLSKNTFVAIEKIVLPDWDETDCPWCHEHRCLSNWREWAADSSVLEFIDDRIAYLRESQASGLNRNLLWTPTFESDLEIGPKSLFITGSNLNQADIALSMASSLQHMRKNSPFLGQRFPKRVLLHRDEIFLKKWSDQILTFLLWRLAMVNEVRSPIFDVESRADRDFTAMLNKIGTSRTAALEIVVGLITEKVRNRPGQIQIPPGELEHIEYKLLEAIIQGEQVFTMAAKVKT